MDLDYFRSRLRVNKHALDDELEIQSDHMEKIGRQTAAAARREAAAKQNLESVESGLIKDLMADDSKMSHARASTDIKGNRGWKEAHSQVLNAKQELAEWEALEKAWYNRGFDLKALGELFIGQYFAITSVGGPSKHSSEADIRRSIRQATGSDFIDRQKDKATRNGRVSLAEDQPPSRRRSLDG